MDRAITDPIYPPQRIALAAIASTSLCLQSGMRGMAEIHTGYEPLGHRAWRFIRRVFHFET